MQLSCKKQQPSSMISKVLVKIQAILSILFFKKVCGFMIHEKRIISTCVTRRTNTFPTALLDTTSNNQEPKPLGNESSDDSNAKAVKYDIDDRPRYRSNLQFIKNQAGRQTKSVTNTRRPKKNLKSKESSTSKDSKPSITDASQILPQLINEEYSIDSFLNGEYDRPFSEDAAAPHPGLSPQETIEAALHALRNLNVPNQNHGAAVFSRFLAPLTRSERWGGSVSGTVCPWKEILRGSLTPTMLARRIRASKEFSVLLDWESVDVTEGLSVPGSNETVGSTVAFVNAALYFQSSGIEPFIVQFTLRKISGVWLIDSAVISKREWFIAAEGTGGNSSES